MGNEPICTVRIAGGVGNVMAGPPSGAPSRRSRGRRIVTSMKKRNLFAGNNGPGGLARPRPLGNRSRHPRPASGSANGIRPPGPNVRRRSSAPLVTEFARGSYVEPSKTTLAAFLDQWLTQIEPQVAPRTHERDEKIALKNLVPLLGQTVLTKLRPEQIATAYSKALRSGRRDGSGGLSARTVHHMHRMLKQALAIAVRWRMLATTPSIVSIPRRSSVARWPC